MATKRRILLVLFWMGEKIPLVDYRVLFVSLILESGVGIVEIS